MWIRNLPTDYHKQQSDFDNLVFLWKTNNVYVMDNHLAAAWCWMQECDADTRYNFMHIDRHNDLGTNTPFDIYRNIKDNQHLSIDEYTNLSWTNEGNGITLKAFRWDNYITQCMYLFPQWFWVVVYSTRTSLGRSEREKLLGAEIHGLSATELLNYIDNNIYGEEDIKKLNEMIGKKAKKWIINLDLDYFYESNDDGFFQLLSDEYISMLAYKLKNIRDQIQVLTIALSSECCRNWDNSLHALNIFMETFEGRSFCFPEDYQ